MNDETASFGIMLVWVCASIISVEVEYPGAVPGQLVHEYLFLSAYHSCYGLVPGFVFLSDFIV